MGLTFALSLFAILFFAGTLALLLIATVRLMRSQKRAKAEDAPALAQPGDAVDFEAQRRADIAANRDGLPMLDHISQAWHYNNDHLTARASRQAIDLATLYPALPAEDLADIVERVNNLWSNAYYYGNLRYLGEPDDKLNRNMREQHPGFSDETYQRVLCRSLFEAR